MICTSVNHVCPLARLIVTKLCLCLSYFPSFFGHFERLAFFENGGTNLTPKQSNRMFLVNFLKVQQLRVTFCKTDPPEIHDPLDFLDFWHMC